MADRHAKALKAYIERHEYDWQILENFKTGIKHTADAATPLEAILDKGIAIRAEAMLREAVKTMANPYSEPFLALEQGMAHIITDSVQPQTVDSMIHNKTPILFFDDHDLCHTKEIKAFPTYASGLFEPSVPRNDYFSDFILAADPNLSMNGLAIALRHEAEHMVDIKSPQIFIEKYADTLPTLKQADIENLNAVEKHIRETHATSEPSALNQLMILGKKRGLRLNQDKIEEAKENLLADIAAIKTRASIFIPAFAQCDFDAVADFDVVAKYLNTLSKQEADALKKCTFKISYGYEDEVAQNMEIPAIMEDMKGRFGRNFIKAILPNLARATDEHRNVIYAIKGEEPATGTSIG